MAPSCLPPMAVDLAGTVDRAGHVTASVMVRARPGRGLGPIAAVIGRGSRDRTAAGTGRGRPIADRQPVANTSRTPGAGVVNWCREHSDAAFIPMGATGHDPIYAWRCHGTAPQIVRQMQDVDQRGFIASYWRELP